MLVAFVPSIMEMVVGQAFGIRLLVPETIRILFMIFVIIDAIIPRTGLGMFEREETHSRIR